jgi:hypothetical protein
MLDTPALKAGKNKGASYDLAPPGAAERAEIARAPAAAAPLNFELDPAPGEKFDERLLREADRPDMPPLVQLALSRLWDSREIRGGEIVLTFAAFEKLGGVKSVLGSAQCGDNGSSRPASARHHNRSERSRACCPVTPSAPRRRSTAAATR